MNHNPIRTIIVAVTMVIALGGIASGVLYGYDQLPSRYGGGWIHAAASAFCGKVCLCGGAGLLIGGVVMLRAFRNPSARFYVGSGIVIMSSAMLMAFGVTTIRGMHSRAKVKSYEAKSSTELLRLVSDEKDVYAIHELGERKVQAAVQLLCMILDDPKADVQVRFVCASALGDIGDDRAVESLRRASLHEDLRSGAESALARIVDQKTQ